jgi:hypothetical protein
VDRRVVNFLSEPDASAVALLQLVGACRGQIRAPAGANHRHGEQATRAGVGGVRGLVNGWRIVVGNTRYFAVKRICSPERFVQQIATLQDESKTSVIDGEIDEITGSAPDSLEPSPSPTYCAPTRFPWSSS